jgi:hypothetical protein
MHRLRADDGQIPQAAPDLERLTFEVEPTPPFHSWEEPPHFAGDDNPVDRPKEMPT